MEIFEYGYMNTNVLKDEEMRRKIIQELILDFRYSIQIYSIYQL